jgi:FAD/FMN-containing dehydrogenase
VDPSSLEDLGRGLRGRALAPGDPGYDDARQVWNGAIDRRPAVIAMCQDVADVRRSLRYAREHDLTVAVRGGGHSVAGHGVCEGGLVIHLGEMRGMRLDADRRVVTAAGGATWQELDACTQSAGLAVTGGQVGSTGIGGLTLGGGLGWLMRKHGLTCDNLLAADLVTADGALVRASAEENGDLLWGLKGGGGNFGVAVSLEYRLHPLGEVLGGMLVYRPERAPEVLRLYRELAQEAPEELNTEVVFSVLPRQPLFPEELQGGPAVTLWICWLGEMEAGERLVASLRQRLAPERELVWPMGYEGMQALQASPPGQPRYHRSDFLSGLGDDAIEAILERGLNLPDERANVVIHHMGGAVAAVPADATAFVHRRAEFFFMVASGWSEPGDRERQVDWARSVWSGAHRHAHGVYVNFLEDEGEARLRSAYGPAYERLTALKDAYDPGNVFRCNQNVRPSGRRERSR